HAGAAGLEGGYRDVHQALAGLGLCRHRQSAVLPRQHHDAARRRQEGYREHRQGDVRQAQRGAADEAAPRMTILKWIAILLAGGYLAGLVMLYAKQSEML